jgi:hypothetical protein
MTGRVQDCGCIALTEALQEQTGLYPGATYTIELNPDGSLQLVPLEKRPPSEPACGAQCA